MSDLVERLREYASDDHERGCQGRCYDCTCGYDDKRDPLLEEAADRIEQLEAALLELLEADDNLRELMPRRVSEALIEGALIRVRTAKDKARAALEAPA